MTQEEKARAYDEALNKAKIEINTKGIGETVNLCYQLFPQLAKSDDEESEDERIINQLITLVNSAGEVLLIPTNKEELVAWLNKCKESLHIPETCKENADSFTDEDERIRKWLYDLVDEGAYLCERPFATESILAYLEKQKEPENVSASTMIPSCWEVKQKEQKPHTDEEKEYIRTIKSIISDFIRDKKPENLAYYQRIYDWLDGRHVPFSCGHENGAKWSKEDEKDIAHIIRILDDCYAYGKHDLSKTDHENLVGTLKSLRPQSHCKISEELDTDTLRDWSMRFTPDIREAIESTAYHFYNLGSQPKQEWSDEDKAILEWCIADIERAKSHPSQTKPELCDIEINWLKALNLKKRNEDVAKLCSNEWSEEDKAFLKVAIATCNRYSHKDIADWLKSLPERLNLQPKEEWSEEDEEMMTDIIESLEYAYPNDNEFRIAWLKSLRPSWKPSEEQMDRLSSIVAALRKDYCDDMADFLSNLYADLKKL